IAGSANSVSAANIVGHVQVTQLPVGVVMNNQRGVTLGGTFNGNGSGLTDLSAANLTGTAANLSVRNITVNSNLYLPATTATAGIIYAGGATMMHAYGPNNFFGGLGAGNLTMTGDGNTGIGDNALPNNASGRFNTAVGQAALLNNNNGW